MSNSVYSWQRRLNTLEADKRMKNNRAASECWSEVSKETSQSGTICKNSFISFHSFRLFNSNSPQTALNTKLNFHHSSCLSSSFFNSPVFFWGFFFAMSNSALKHPPEASNRGSDLCLPCHSFFQAASWRRKKGSQQKHYKGTRPCSA